MPKRIEALINPELLIWARHSLAMSRAEAAHKLGVTDEVLFSWEKGERRPTVKQAQKAAQVYRQNFAAFYLPEPPEVFRPPLHDYRRLPEDGESGMSADLMLDVRTSLDRREVCLELMSDQEQTPPDFHARTDQRKTPESVGDKVRKILGIEIATQRQWHEPSRAFKVLRELAERQGILVFQAPRVALEEMRGYSIWASPLPVIVVNRKDAHAGRVFTLLHEVCHLMLRSSGICDPEIVGGRPPREERIEVFCNHVAGAALVPSSSLLSEPELQGQQAGVWEDTILRALSRRYGVSREVILRRLLILGRTSEEFYRSKRAQWQVEYQRRKPQGGFVSPPTDVVSRGGGTFTRLVLDAYHSDRITSSDVSDYLGVRVKHLETIAEAVGRT